MQNNALPDDALDGRYWPCTQVIRVRPGHPDVDVISRLEATRTTDANDPVYLVGDLVTVHAYVVNPAGSTTYQYAWSGDRGWGSEDPTTVLYTTSTPKSQTISVTVSGGGRTGLAEVTLVYEGVEVEVEHSRSSGGFALTANVMPQLEHHARYWGLSSLPLYVLWQPYTDDGVKFGGEAPPEEDFIVPIRGKGAVQQTVRFTQPGTYTVWAEILVRLGPEKRTVGSAETTIVQQD